jgi:hypothetical protein
MFEKFTSMESHDFRQRYQGTYGFFTHQGKKTLTRLDKVFAEGKASYVEFSDKDGLKYLLHPDSENEGTGFEFLPPKSAWFNTKEGIPLLVSRIPARQYQRGICDKNTSITDIRNNNRPVDFEFLSMLFGQNISAASALVSAKETGNGAAGVAISPQFVVGFNTHNIKCFNQTIGYAEYSKGMFTIELDSPELWTQEVTDAFRRSGLAMQFK